MNYELGQGRSIPGFSLVELLVALAIALLVTSAVFAMLDPAAGAFQTQPEAADVQQRLRASTEALYRDLLAAGSEPSTALASRSSGQLAAAVFPMRIGRRSPDAPGTFNDSRITVWHVSPAAAQTTLASPLASASGAVTVASGAGCPNADPSCGFRAGMTAAVFGPSGAWDLFSIISVQGNSLTLQHNLRDAPVVYPAGATLIAEVTIRTYFFKDDPAAGGPQFMRYDGAGAADAPVVEHLARLQFEYLGEAEPAALVPATDLSEPKRVTYGPLPPEASVQLTAYPPGENCAFVRTAGGAIASRLPRLAGGPAPVPLTASLLTDGPWCPDAANPNRYDADLLRVREIVVTIALESTVAALRGPAGILFTRGGTARGTRTVPDRVARLVVAPRALNAGR